MSDNFEKFRNRRRNPGKQRDRKRTIKDYRKGLDNDKRGWYNEREERKQD